MLLNVLEYYFLYKPIRTVTVEVGEEFVDLVAIIHCLNQVCRADLRQLDAVIDDDSVAERGIYETGDVLSIHCILAC